MKENTAGNIGDPCQKEMSFKRVGVYEHKITRGQCLCGCVGVRAHACTKVNGKRKRAQLDNFFRHRKKDKEKSPGKKEKN